MRQLVYLLALMVFLPLIAEGKKNVVAYVNNEILTEQDLDEEIKKPQWRGIDASLDRDFQGEALTRRRQNLRRKVLESMITDSLIHEEAKKMVPVIPKSEIDRMITHHVKVNRLTTKEQLKQQLKLENVDWKDFLKDLEKMRRVEFLKSHHIYSRIRISPKQVYSFYQQRKNDVEPPSRKDGLGQVHQVVLRMPDLIFVQLLEIYPDLHGKQVNPNEFEELKIQARQLSNAFDTVRSKGEEAVKKWLVEAQGKYPKLLLKLSSQKIATNSLLPQNLKDFAFDKKNKGKWSLASMIQEPSNNPAHPIERWMRIRVERHQPSQLRPFTQIRKEIERHLKEAAQDREMKILRERLWKQGGVKIILPKSN